ncbi:MAG: deoxyribodipyrimidine photo-lyase [Acidimicrobiales bacterium]|nr:deoxyribodipyrimidine photo-lyase [Acidimicrobiales bacterium]
MRTTVVWFRRDLRLADNPALVTAVRGATRVVPLFVADGAVLSACAGQPRAAWTIACAAALDAALGGRLVVRRGDPVVEVVGLARDVGATEVHVADDPSPWGARRDAAVEAALVADGRALVGTGSPYAVPPGTLLTGDGRPYRVFTPFSRAWRAQGWASPTPAPVGVPWAEGVASDGLPGLGSPVPLPPPGEEAALARLDAFLDDGVAGYDERRNLPGVEGTSRLSPYLKTGCLHPRQILHRLRDRPGDRVFESELCWREFYADVLARRPDSAWAPLQAGPGAIQVDTGAAAAEHFEAWAEGRTGYPLVDAGMRQLHAEGWMHNRVRMVAASFLVKDLHLAWQWGARHFLAWLLDADLASNNHGWQWVAGTGTDAAPYHRVFNPVTQSKRFDPDGTYLRRYLPELGGLADAELHEPWARRGGPPLGYPPPIVDHAEERVEALRRYEEVRGRGGRR